MIQTSCIDDVGSSSSIIGASISVISMMSNSRRIIEDQLQQMTNTSETSGQAGVLIEADAKKDAQETAEDAGALKRFKIINLIGTGNYSRVYRAVSQSGKELAIKTINLSKTTENYQHKFLPRELTILKKISHVNICKTQEIIQIGERVYIIMQYCPRGTIADLLHKLGPLSEPVARGLFGPTIDAVSYLHSLDYAHRDLKVENILLDHDFNPKLTDFSYSVYTGDKQTRARTTVQSPTNNHQTKKSMFKTGFSPRLNETFCGTLPYLSPEMIRQQPYDSKKTDMWSLGVCLYVMLNDKLPFPFNDVRQMLKKQMTRDYKFKQDSNFSSQCKDLIALLLEPDLNRRLTCFDAIKHPWLFGTREKPPVR